MAKRKPTPPPAPPPPPDPPKRGGRPKIVIDLVEVKEAAAGGLSQTEVAAKLGISLATLMRRKRQFDNFDKAIKEGQAKAHGEVSSMLMTLVRDKNLGAVVWYEKTRKGLSDKLDLGGIDIDAAIERELARLAAGRKVANAGSSSEADARHDGDAGVAAHPEQPAVDGLPEPGG
jgi:Trp operon repressor